MQARPFSRPLSREDWEMLLHALPQPVAADVQRDAKAS